MNRVGDDGCSELLNMDVQGSVPAVFVARDTGYGFFDVPGYDEPTCREGDPDWLEGSHIPGVNVRDTGDVVTIRTFFDGWGYVHLFQNSGGKMAELDTYAIPEAHDPAHASGSGDLSVHEVATSQVRRDLAYFSYYSGGFRVAKIQGGKLTEVGHFIDEKGNDFWGVEVIPDPDNPGEVLILASDRDYGLFIFRDP